MARLHAEQPAYPIHPSDQQFIHRQDQQQRQRADNEPFQCRPNFPGDEALSKSWMRFCDKPLSLSRQPLQEIVFPFPMDIPGSLGIVPDERKFIHLRIQYIRFPNARRDFF